VSGILSFAIATISGGMGGSLRYLVGKMISHMPFLMLIAKKELEK
jgi:hypothetical protein